MNVRWHIELGGLDSVLRAIECKNICTTVFSSGLQVSGVFNKVYQTTNNTIKYINTIGPTSLAFNNQLIEGHGPNYHVHGFGSPIGNLVGSDKKLEDYTLQDLLANGIILHSNVVLKFENGIEVNGKLVNQTYKENKLVLLSFAECQVTDTDGTVFFEPAWGLFDMAIGDAIISVFNGVADKKISEDQLYLSEKNTNQQNYTTKDLQYQALFSKIRAYREQKNSDDSLNAFWDEIKNNFEADWLGAIELLELADTIPSQIVMANELRLYLKTQILKYPKFAKLINDGLKIIDSKLKFE